MQRGSIVSLKQVPMAMQGHASSGALTRCFDRGPPRCVSGASEHRSYGFKKRFDGRPEPTKLPLIGLVSCFLLAATAQPAIALETGASSTARSFYDALLTVMRNGPALGISGRYAQLEPAVARTFDIPFMTQLAVGPVWSSLTDLQRQQVTQAFGRYVAAIYADRFTSYSGQRMDVLSEQPSANGMRVNSKIVKADGQPVGVGYLVRENAGVWRVVDVYFEGTISEMATRRSEFATILRSSGIEGLIQVLRRKADELGAPIRP